MIGRDSGPASVRSQPDAGWRPRRDARDHDLDLWGAESRHLLGGDRGQLVGDPAEGAARRGRAGSRRRDAEVGGLRGSGFSWSSRSAGEEARVQREQAVAPGVEPGRHRMRGGESSWALDSVRPVARTPRLAPGRRAASARAVWAVAARSGALSLLAQAARSSAAQTAAARRAAGRPPRPALRPRRGTTSRSRRPRRRWGC